MDFTLTKYRDADLQELVQIWNETIDEGMTLPWIEHFSEATAKDIVSKQVAVYCAWIENDMVGFYLLHPNYSGRCSHIANALYIVKKEYRGNGIGEALVIHSLQEGKKEQFLSMQFNSVVASNYSVQLYEKLGFQTVGVIQKGFKLSNGEFDDLLIMIRQL